MSKIKWDVFLGAGLRQPNCAERNQKLIDQIFSEGLTIFAPQVETPQDRVITPLEIFNQNRAAIRSSTCFLFVPDGAGHGVYYELGYADALDKMVIGFSSEGVKGLGKAIEGRWAALPPALRTTNLDELKMAMQSLKRSRTSR
ncbi:MAG TPA: nucleoside 2-deoxyribosyltransferase [Verrucomicrobiae bacterium]|jgi:nucleoside 2-deoxyribosyltransferase|nr:nucleoside 2-deoxyribosyltransferase [Verrucomicrobiae bacterium]